MSDVPDFCVLKTWLAEGGGKSLRRIQSGHGVFELRLRVLASPPHEAFTLLGIYWLVRQAACDSGCIGLNSTRANSATSLSKIVFVFGVTKPGCS